MESKDRRGENEIDFVWFRKSDGYAWGSESDIQSELADYLMSIRKSVDMDIYDKEEEYSPETLYLRGSLASEIKASRPLDDMALFANFAEIEATPENFVKWSGKYGPLTAREPYGFSRSESMDFWLNEQRDLRLTLSIWELAVNKDTEKLKKIISWTDNNTAVKVNHVERKFIEGLGAEYPDDSDYIKQHTFKESAVLFDKSNTRSWFSNLCRYPDVIKPALFYVQTVISKKLNDHPLNVEIKSDELEGNLFKVLRPTSLISAMWYQFYLVLIGEEKIRRCDLCGKWQDMRGHRASWKRHKSCAGNERVKRFRQAGGSQS